MTTRIQFTQELYVGNPAMRVYPGMVIDDLDDSEASYYISIGIAVAAPVTPVNTGPVNDIEAIQEETNG